MLSSLPIIFFCYMRYTNQLDGLFQNFTAFRFWYSSKLSDTVENNCLAVCFDTLCTCLQETAKSVIEDDSFYTLSLLKRGVCHGFAPQTFVCCICNCSLSKEGAISAVRLFSCGHATHLQCESEQSRSSNRESKDGCPVCLSTSNTQARNKSPMFENGLAKYSGAEHEPSRGIHQIHEVDHAERSRGLQHMSRVICQMDAFLTSENVSS